MPASIDDCMTPSGQASDYATENFTWYWKGGGGGSWYMLHVTAVLFHLAVFKVNST